MNRDQWLDRWISLIQKRAAATPVLELGCGQGWDTEFLYQHGLQVVAVDVSQQAIDIALKRIPEAQFFCQDVRDPVPGNGEDYHVVVASLSLHYFTWQETVSLIARIRGSLSADGLFLLRVNSTNDVNYGANGHTRIEPNYFSVKGKPKRFFDQSAVHRLFQSGWKTLAEEEMTIDRYAKPKVVWEVLLEKAA